MRIGQFAVAFFFVTISITSSYSQCTTVPVKDAVRNGDFEAGYLTGPALGVHTFTPGGVFDFYSDFKFSGSVPAYPTATCNWDFGDKYGVVRSENFTCSGTSAYTNKPYWGIDYPGAAVNLIDHTPGKAGKGYSLFVDLNLQTVSPLTGGKPIAWSQTVDIAPSQNYYFSAWMANWNVASGAPPVLQVTIVPFRVSDGLADPPITLPVTGITTGVMTWNQIYSIWTPAGVYNKATIRLEFVNTASGGSGLDVLIDDISFVNSCQYLTGNSVPDFGYDTTSVCGAAGGSITLNANYPPAAAVNASFVWFSGSGATQTLIAGATTQTYTTNTPGTYRVCVQDPDNGCAVNDIVVVNTKFTTSLNNATLCNPATATLNGTPTPSTGSPISYAWTVPSGSTNPGNAATATANVAGSYSVIVTGPNYNGGTCSATASNTVTSTLPPIPTTLTYCDGGGTSTALTIGDGKPYYWYTDAAATIPLNGTLAASTGTSVTWAPPGGTTGNKTFYVVNAQTSPLATLNATTWSWETQPNAMTMTITQPVMLKTVQVQVASWVGATTPVTVNLTGAQTLNVTQTISTGSSATVTLNWLLTPGTYQINYTKGGAFLKDFIANATATGVTLSGTNVGFVNMVFEASLACAPVPVVVSAFACCVPATINTQPINQTTCVNAASPDFSVTATGTALTYQWQESLNAGVTWTDISGQTASTLSITPTSTSWTGRRYRVVILTSGTCPAYSTGATLTANAVTSITTQPTPTTTFCSSMGNFDITVNYTGTGPYTLQWQKDAINVGMPIGPTNALGAQYFFGGPSLVHAGNYTLFVSGACGNVSSNAAALIINDVSITTQPTNQGTCIGGAVTFSTVATGVATLSYQWQLSTNSGITWTDIVGATSASYSVASATLIMNGYQYRVIAKSNNACAVTSSSAVLSVNATTNINTQPLTTSICAPAALTLTVSASGSGVVSYQWYKGGVAIVGETASTFTIPVTASTDAGTYSVDATSACGTTLSSNAIVTVNQASVSTQPIATSSCVAGNASFTVAGSGIPTISYQWEVSTNGGATWTAVSGATATALNLTAVTIGMNANQYRAVVKSNSLCPANSNAALLTVNAATNITTQPASVTLCEPAALTLSVAGTGSGTITYQWKKGGAPIIGATNNTYTIASTAVTDAGSYTVDVSSNCGTTTSTTAVVTVQTAAVGGLTVTGGEACKNANTSVVVQSTQLGVSYEAFVGATSISSAIPGTGGTVTVPILGSGLAAGTNTIVVKAIGCNTVNLPSTTILVVDTPGSITGNATVCDNANTAVNYSIAPVLGAATYNWTVSNSGVIASGQGSTAIVTSIVNSPTTVAVTPVSANGLSCTNATLSVIILSEYQFTDGLAASSTTICSGVSVTFTVTNPSAETYTNWTVPAGATIQSTTATSAIVLFGTTGGNVSVQPNHQCNPGLTPLTAAVNVIPKPEANAGVDIKLDELKEFTLDGSLSPQNSNYVYLWTSSDPSSTIVSPSSISSQASVNALESYFSLLINVPGMSNCSATDQVKVTVHFEVKIPNTFSPNGDGIHDYFVVQNSNYFLNAEIIIYNQWGEKVYTSKEVFNKPWDGTRNGKEAPISAYYYVLKLNQSGYDDLSGEINLLR